MELRYESSAAQLFDLDNAGGLNDEVGWVSGGPVLRARNGLQLG